MIVIVFSIALALSLAYFIKVRRIFSGTAANIAGITMPDTLLTHSRQCPRIRHDPRSHQCLHNPISLKAAEKSPERNVTMRPVSRDRDRQGACL